VIKVDNHDLLAIFREPRRRGFLLDRRRPALKFARVVDDYQYSQHPS
jgi:hypothetical protein